MLCTNCGKRTAATYTRKTDGKEVKLFLCPACYEKLYPEKDAADFFTQFIGNTGGRRSKACPSCGTRLGDFRRTGLLGCADCYSAFREELIPTVRYIQWEVKHEGKSPEGVAEQKYDLVRDLVREQDAVKAELDNALLSGDLVLADRLELRIKEINRKIAHAEEEV